MALNVKNLAPVIHALCFMYHGEVWTFLHYIQSQGHFSADVSQVSTTHMGKMAAMIQTHWFEHCPPYQEN